MNYFAQTKNKDDITIDIHVHPKKLIVKIDGAIKLYEHDELWTAVNSIKDYFSEKQVDSIITNLFANYKASNIEIPFGQIEVGGCDNNNDEQLSLF